MSIRLSYPGKVPLFYLPSTGGGQSGPAATRSKYNLVLVFLEDGPAGEAYLLALSRIYRAILDETARLIAVVPGSLTCVQALAERLHLPFTLLADEGRAVTQRLLGPEATAALAVADRYGVLYYLQTAPTTADLPPAQSVREWLEFVQIQCPE